MQKIILEISVDRNNEKWVFVAEQILNVLHDTLEETKILFWTKTDKSPEFSFEIVNIKWIIRFFFITTEEYKDLIQNQIYAHFPNVEIREVKEYLNEDSNFFIWKVSLIKEYFYPIKIYTNFKEKTEKENIDPFSSVTSSLNKIWDKNIKFIQINFSPIWETKWKNKKIIDILSSSYPKFIKNILISKYSLILKIFLWPFYIIFKWLLLIFNPTKNLKKSDDENIKLDQNISKKLESFWFNISLNIWVENNNEVIAKSYIKEIFSSLNIFNIAWQNWFKLMSIQKWIFNKIQNRINTKEMILNSAELAWLIHLPTIYVQTPWINWVTTKTLEPPNNIPILETNNDISPVWYSNFRWAKINFWILPNDRRRHVYIIWKTWMWKSALLENMIYEDICKWKWLALIDPHWDLADNLISNIPKNSTHDVVLFDPSDYKHPIAFNMLENVSKELRPLVASWLIWVFKRIWADSWWPRLEHILRNTVLSLLEIPDSTIMSIPLILTNKSFRLKIVSKLKDPVTSKFWSQEFDIMDQRQMTEAISPILNKVWQFLSNPLLRNILWQPKNPFSLRWIMDNSKILIINLSKWKIWEDSMSLLWSMMVTKFQIDAMSRADIEEDKRKDFYLYVEEFQNFATDSFATILSEARKYKLNLIVANQYIEQMSETIRWAVFGNVWSIISFQVWPQDAQVLADAIWDWEIITPNDMMNIKKYDIYIKLLIEWMPSRTFSATTFPPIKFKEKQDEQKKEIILKVNREKYSKNADFVENKIIEFNKKIIEEEKKFKEEQRLYKEKMKSEKKN